MNSGTCVSTLADSLAAVIDEWQLAVAASAAPPAAAPARPAFSEQLNALAEQAEAAGREADGQILRRAAVLSEVWDCLAGDPSQADAAAELAAFCSDAMARVASHKSATTRDAEADALWVVRRSDERWSDYLALFDHAGSVDADLANADELACFPEPELPSAIDARTLLRLITGASDHQEELPQATKAERPVAAPGRRDHSPAVSEPENHRSARPRSAAAPAPPVPSGALEPAPGPPASASGFEIPSLPASVDLDDEIREAFLADATELFERIESLVVGLSTQGDPRGALHELARCFHTLKGAAGSVGLMDLANLVHELEEQLGEASGQISHALHDSLHQVVGYLDGVIRLLRPGASQNDGSTVPDETAGEDVETAVAGVESGEHHQGSTVDAPLRVSTARFDELTDLAGELIAQGRFWVTQAEAIATFAATVKTARNRLLTSMEQLHESGLARASRSPRATAGLQADLPVQLSRLAEQADDLTDVAGSALAAAGVMADRGDTLVRLSRQLWDSFQSLRIVPIRGLFHRLARVVHDAERVEGKRVELVMIGEGTGVDRAIQDRAFEPLLHVVRNAVAHGIEAPSDRARAGKPATGRVTLEARRDGNTLVIAVEDDGKGLDDLAIADKARRLGWLGKDEKPSQERLRAFIFQPGFSTKANASAISGRGVGMDVVAREISKLHGTIGLTSQPGRGARVTLRLPPQLALETTLIVRVAGQGLAVPASRIECVEPYLPSAGNSGPSASCRENGSSSAPSTTAVPTVVINDHAVPVVFARDTLGIRRSTLPPWSMLLVVNTDSRMIGLVVDAIERTEDLVTKPLGALLAGHPLVSGTSLSINGELISILNPGGLDRWLSVRDISEQGCAPLSPGPERPRRLPVAGATVLVVDDSISVRRGVARQLRGLGLSVEEVSDGMEALTRLRHSNYELVVTDLEMPRLDGFALLAEMKRSPALSAIPAVVVSTLVDDLTRRRVLELGALALLSKPVDPRELARTVEPYRPGVDRARTCEDLAEARHGG